MVRFLETRASPSRRQTTPTTTNGVRDATVGARDDRGGVFIGLGGAPWR
jgi:hypothetical protein